MNATEHPSLCVLCGAACGLIVRMENGRIVKISGDEKDPLSAGYVCPKGASLAEFHNDPDRIVHPMRRVGEDKWEPVEWEAALDEIAGRLAEIQKKRGRDAVGLYVGTQVSHIYSALLFLGPFLQVLGTKNFYTANSVDARPRMLASKLLYGNPALLPIPDIERTGYFLILGANPVVSNGSVMTAPGFARRIRAMRERGARVVVLDPRRSETAALADEHHFIRPGADAAFLLGLLHTIFAERLFKEKTGGPRLRVEGLDAVRRIAGEFPPERVAKATGIEADAVRKIARDFCAAPSAVCYGRMGTCAQSFGALSSWLIDAVNVVTGNCDRPGGAMFAAPAVDLSGLINALGMNQPPGRWRSRTGGHAEFGGELPVSALADEIETPGEGRLRAMIVTAGNPVLTAPNGRRMDRAFAALDFLVCIDPCLNETSRHAHFILPPALALEHDNYPMAAYAFPVRDVARWAPALLAPPDGVREDWEILRDLALRLAAERTPAPRLAKTALQAASRPLTPRRALELALAFGPRGALGAAGKGRRKKISFSDLKKNPHGIDLGSLQPGRLRELLGRKAVNLAPPALTADVERLKAWLGEFDRAAAKSNRTVKTGGAGGEGDLLLISRRHLRSMNSSAHNVETLANGKDRHALQMHPDDAKTRRIGDGDAVVLQTRVGTEETVARLTDSIMPGVVCLPFGWGHHRPGTRLSVAAKYAGVSVNDLTDETLVDALSGTAAINGVPVRVWRKTETEGKCARPKVK